MKNRMAAALLFSASLWAQTHAGRNPAPAGAEMQDAETTKNELSQLLQRYPPALRDALGADPTLLQNESYVQPYPALSSFLQAHPEVARDGDYYVDRFRRRPVTDQHAEVVGIWREMVQGIAVFGGFGMAAAMIVWLTRTVIDARRWNRVAKVQTEVHMKLLDRFSNNDDLLAYAQSPAGAKFLQSAPINLEPAQRGVGAPLSRILWSMQGGIVLLAGGLGLLFVSGRVSLEEAQQPLHGLGILAIALGVGFIASAGMSYLISKRLGLIEINGRGNAAAELP